jgi:hypothetical protein
MAEPKKPSRELVCEYCCECCCEKCCESIGAPSRNGSAPLHPSRVHWYEYPAPQICVLVAVRGGRKATGGVATDDEELLCIIEGG